jgi:RES domain-containing protein
MILYRFSNKNYGVDVTGEGARLNGGRWNSKGIPVVYTSSTISLSLLELVIHSASFDEIRSNLLLKISLPDNSVTSLADLKIKEDWQGDPGYSRFIGDSFLRSKKSLLLKVPSAIIPEEYNVLINPLHPDIKKVKVADASLFQFDTRLFK